MDKVSRLWLGITEYLYRQPGLLDECIHVAIHDNTFRRDDLEFTFAARVLPHNTRFRTELTMTGLGGMRVVFRF
jgi:predicted nuclease with RNAse H fold